jgi:hypothetical protein
MLASGKNASHLLRVSIISSIFSPQIRNLGHMTTDIITIRELAA